MGRCNILNVLPLLLIGILLGGERLSPIKEFLSKIDFASFSPIFSLLGVDKKTVDFLSSEDFEKMLSSSGNLTDLIPLLGSLFAKNTAPKSDATTDETDGEKNTSDY